MIIAKFYQKFLPNLEVFTNLHDAVKKKYNIFQLLRGHIPPQTTLTWHRIIPPTSKTDLRPWTYIEEFCINMYTNLPV